jgi:HK97 family phage portal protein
MEFLKRSMASSDAFFVQSKPTTWTEWRIDNAVKNGYKINPWVFRAIQLISQNASGVPWVVYDDKMSPVWEHPISLLFKRPNPHFSRQKLMELVVSWLELSGNAYLKLIFVNGQVKEIWPISPDRISPVPSTDPSKFIDGYKVVRDGGAEVIDPDFNDENILHIKLFDPSNPYLGISPLQAASKSVDLDNAQLEWNTSTMQNRGVVDGVFTFKRPIDGAQAQSIMERIVDKFSGRKNARKPLVIGDDATYTRLSLNPIELDFQNSRKHNREEILSVFGVPPQLIGIQDSSTYNNYAISMRIFWETTVLPLLDMIKDAFNHHFQLEGGYSIGYDISEVAALRNNEDEKAKIAKTYYEIGVPVSVTNEKLSLGLPAYEGWDVVSRVIMPDEAGAAQLQPAKEAEANNPQLEDNVDSNVRKAFASLKNKVDSSQNVDNLDKAVRAFGDDLINGITDRDSLTRLIELRSKVEHSVNTQVAYGVSLNHDIAKLKQSIYDTGIFSIIN